MIKVKGPRNRETKRYRTTREMLRETTRMYGEREAFVFRRKPQLTPEYRNYRELLHDVEALGTAVTVDDPGRPHMAVIGKNSYEWVVTHFAALNGAGISVPLDMQLPAREIGILLEQGDCDLVFYSPEQHEKILACAEENTRIRHYILMDPVTPEEDRPQLPDDPRFTTWTEMVQRGMAYLEQGERTFLDRALDEDAPAAIYFTSGTTAAAKGVVLSQRNIMFNTWAIASTFELHNTDRFLSILPLHHKFENTIGVFEIVNCGASCYYMDGLRYLNQNINEWKITAMIGVPLLFETIYRHIMREVERQGKTDLVRRGMKVSRFLSKLGIDIRRTLFRPVLDALGGEMRLMVVGAAPCEISVLEGYNALGINCFQGYGLTEHAPVVSTETERNFKSPGSVGLPLADVEVAINTSDDTLGEANQGEILVRSESVMLGYYKRPDLTEEVIDADGWLHTGDMGYLDEGKNLHITGRLKSMIVLANGKKAFPEEIEMLLNDIPGIHGSMAWGETNAREAVDICVRVEWAPDEIEDGHPQDEAWVEAYLREAMQTLNDSMPRYKAIKYFVYSETPLIRTTTLKVRRRPEEERIHAWLASEDLTMRAADGMRMP